MLYVRLHNFFVYTNYAQILEKYTVHNRFFFIISGRWSLDWVHAALRPLLGLLYLSRARTRASAVRIQRLTASAMARPTQ
jgi:hypothetical protein